MTQREAAARLDIPRSTLCKILKNPIEIERAATNMNRKIKREAKEVDVGDALSGSQLLAY